MALNVIMGRQTYKHTHNGQFLLTEQGTQAKI